MPQRPVRPVFLDRAGEQRAPKPPAAAFFADEQIIRLVFRIPVRQVEIARDRAAELHPDVKPSEIGIFFISPCTAKVSYVKNGFAGDKNNIDCVVSVRDTYFKLLDAMKSGEYPAHTSEAGMIGIGWATKKRICP